MQTETTHHRENDQQQEEPSTNNQTVTTTTTTTSQQDADDHHNLLCLRVAYFSSFLARGSLFPFLGVILRSRGASYLMMGIAMNVSAITRLVASSVFVSFTSTSATTTTSTTTTVQTRSTGSSSSSSSLLDISKTILAFCAVLAIIASIVFTLTPTTPLVASIAVATLLSCTSIASLVLDSVAIKIFSTTTTTASSSPACDLHNNEERRNINNAGQIEGDDDENESSTLFGKVRLFGSIGWGIAAPLQVLLMTILYKNNDNGNGYDLDKNDYRAWFPNQNNTSSTSASSTTQPLIATNAIFLIGFSSFLFSVLKLMKNPQKSSSSHQHQHQHQHHQHSIMPTTSLQNEQDEEMNQESTTTTAAITATTSESPHIPVVPHEHNKRTFTLPQLIWSLRFALLFAVLYGLCDDIVGTFFFPFLRKELGVSSTIISIIPTINVLSELPVLAMSKWFHKNYSIYTLHLVFVTLWVIRFSWYAFVLIPINNNNADKDSDQNFTTSSFVVSSQQQQQQQQQHPSTASFFFIFKILIIETINGLCFAGAFVLCIRHVVWIATKQIFVDDVQRVIPLVHAAFFGASSIIGGLCGGLLAENFGVRMVFALIAMICFFVSLIMFMKQISVKVF